MTETTGPFRGCLTALPTPFRQGRIDFAAVTGLMRRQIAGAADAVVLGGSTGEATTLSLDERRALVEFGVGTARGRIPVVAGIGCGDTRDACRLALAAERAGAAGLLATTPPYSRPSAAGLERHFEAVAASTSLPIALYNIPARTGVDLRPASVRRLAGAHEHVVAIKETASLDRVRELVDGGGVAVLCGEDRWIVDALELGCAGVVSVVSNLVPERVSRIARALGPAGDRTGAPAEAEGLARLVAALALDTNPAPLKAALEILGWASGELRLPLVPVSDETRASLAVTLAAAGLTP